MGRLTDVLRGKEMEPFRWEIEAYVEQIMKHYLTECEANCRNLRLSPLYVKNFYDSVWGTIEITQAEIFLIDSPLLQRLRNIKQLGLANLLYSSADHSRFSHTLGVLQTADTMGRQIEKELKKQRVEADADVIQILRLSAIFHDCGHMFCSHASERFFQGNREYSRYLFIEKNRNAMKKALGIKPALSEMISVLMVQSPAVVKLLNIIEKGLDGVNMSGREGEKVIEKICCFILGFPYSERLVPFSQIISGQIDADKLDYLRRDSHSTGVPVAVDMSRVFQKLRVVPSGRKLSMLSTSEDASEKRFTIGIAPAAINTVDQLIISRYMMFENIYFHQKTLTAEESLRYALIKIDRTTEGFLDRFENILEMTDSDIVNADFRNHMAQCAGNFKIKKGQEAEFEEACRILADLQRRRLFKRCAAFTKENLTDISLKGKDFYSNLFSTKIPEKQKAFVDRVIEQTGRLKETLKDSDCHFNERTDILLIIAPDISNVPFNSNIAIADKNNKDRDMEFEADNWLKSRSTRKPQNYLVSYPEDRYLVFIATEYVLLTEYGLVINDSVIFDSSDEKSIEGLKKLLDEKGYFHGADVLAPNADITVFTGEMEDIIQNQWHNYEIVSVDNGNATHMNISYLMMYLKCMINLAVSYGLSAPAMIAAPSAWNGKSTIGTIPAASRKPL